MNDNELCAQSLRMQANWIETGNVVLSAQDALAQERAKHAEGRHRTLTTLRALDVVQMKTVVRLRELADALLSGAATVSPSIPAPPSRQTPGAPTVTPMTCPDCGAATPKSHKGQLLAFCPACNRAPVKPNGRA